MYFQESFIFHHKSVSHALTNPTFASRFLIRYNMGDKPGNSSDEDVPRTEISSIEEIAGLTGVLVPTIALRPRIRTNSTPPPRGDSPQYKSSGGACRTF